MGSHGLPQRELLPRLEALAGIFRAGLAILDELRAVATGAPRGPSAFVVVPRPGPRRRGRSAMDSASGSLFPPHPQSPSGVCVGVGSQISGSGSGSGSDAGARARVRGGGESFDTFWRSYPLRVGKRAARQAWEKLGPTPPLEVILLALAWQRELPRWQEERGRFVPHPATYLNGRRWEDERPPPGALELLNLELAADKA